jgi:hypothetical protein
MHLPVALETFGRYPSELVLYFRARVVSPGAPLVDRRSIVGEFLNEPDPISDQFIDAQADLEHPDVIGEVEETREHGEEQQRPSDWRETNRGGRFCGIERLK